MNVSGLPTVADPRGISIGSYAGYRCRRPQHVGEDTENTAVTAAIEDTIRASGRIPPTRVKIGE